MLAVPSPCLWVKLNESVGTKLGFAPKEFITDIKTISKKNCSFLKGALKDGGKKKTQGSKK